MLLLEKIFIYILYCTIKNLYLCYKQPPIVIRTVRCYSSGGGQCAYELGYGQCSRLGRNTTKILKNVKRHHDPAHLRTVQPLLQLRSLPRALKRSIITPVFKSGDRTEVNNYRSISVLSSISKVIEKLLNARLMRYLDKYKILSSSQYGFRKGLSTLSIYRCYLGSYVFNCQRNS